MGLAVETELRDFWCIAGELRSAAEDGVLGSHGFLFDELAAIEMHTENDALRERCKNLFREVTSGFQTSAAQ